MVSSADKLDLDPQQGELIPNDFVEIKLTLTSSVVPSVYGGEIKCHILRDKREYDEDLLSKSILNPTYKSQIESEASMVISQ